MSPEAAQQRAQDVKAAGRGASGCQPAPPGAATCLRLVASPRAQGYPLYRLPLPLPPSTSRPAVQRELGLAVSVGAAPNRLMAKLASTAAKPDGVYLVPDQQAALALLAQVRWLQIGGEEGSGIVQACSSKNGRCRSPAVRSNPVALQTPASRLPGYGGKAAEAFERRKCGFEEHGGSTHVQSPGAGVAMFSEENSATHDHPS